MGSHFQTYLCVYEAVRYLLDNCQRDIDLFKSVLCKTEELPSKAAQELTQFRQELARRVFRVCGNWAMAAK
jgi:hypothetical protein